MQKRSLFTQPSSLILPNFWDFIALVLVFTVVLSLGWAFAHMNQPFHLGQQLPISLNGDMLPQYALYTTVRMFIALAISFVFTFIVATIAAKSERAGQILIPLIDILQSVPVLGYLSIAVVGFVALFPGSMLGPECAAIFAVFTSQVWNMTLSLYQSIKTVPKELHEATTMYQLSAWQRFWKLEVPFAMPGLLWNAMMSMSGGWFFIVAAEAISVANQHIMLPGIGSYIAEAIIHRSLHAIFYAILTMVLVIFIYDQIIFRPLIAWAEKFKVNETSEDAATSWAFDLFQRTRLVKLLGVFMGFLTDAFINNPLTRIRWFKHKNSQLIKRPPSTINQIIWYGFLVILFVFAMVILWRLVAQKTGLSETWHIIVLGAYTGIRVIAMVILVSCIWIPVGVWVGLRPNVTTKVQPFAQFLAAFPANIFFPIAVILILKFHLNMEIWAAPLMVFGSQWFILFNVIAGASAIPKELRQAADNMQLHGWLRWKRFLLPAIFPYALTGAITAAGASWNASIVAEIIHWGNITLTATGLGSFITINTQDGNFAQLALGIVVMCAWVVLFNVLFWRKLYQFAERRFNLN